MGGGGRRLARVPGRRGLRGGGGGGEVGQVRGAARVGAGSVGVAGDGGSGVPQIPGPALDDEPVAERGGGAVPVDRAEKAVEGEDSFYLVGGERGRSLEVERGVRLKEKEVEEAVGIVVLVVRPPKEEDDDQIADDDWE